MSVMAYCLAFHYHPKQWTMKLVDNLVDAGDQWLVINKKNEVLISKCMQYDAVSSV